MKRCLYFLLFCISSVLGVNDCQSQEKMNARTYNKFVKEYQTTNERSPDKAIITRNDTLVHPFAIATSYFVKAKVYPNEDAIRLIQELNPRIDMNSEESAVVADTRLVLPSYPPPNENVLMQFRADYVKESSPDADLNQRFKILSNAFNRIFQNLPVPEDEVGKKYHDSLAFFNNRILPYINNSAQSISKLQMRYFITELSALNGTFGIRRAPQIYRGGSVNSHPLASYIILDFYEIANPIQVRKKSFYMERRIGSGNSVADLKNREIILFYDLSERPFACNLYIFGKDTLGNRNPDPEMFKYDVWVGDKMSFTTRVNGSAPESYGFLKMGNPASTLPIKIGLGNWIVIMKRQGSAEEFWKEISIVSETVKDPDDPSARKVCYIID